MIYSVTLNPALDVIYTADDFNEKDKYIYSNSTQKFPGGKSINVSRMLYNLNFPSIVTGFVGGSPGKFIRQWMDERKIDNFLIDIEEETRINTRLRTPNKQLTIAGKSPHIDPEKIQKLLFFISRIREGDILSMGGSIPGNVKDDIYIRLAEICKANKAEFVVDVSPKETLKLLTYNPLLIKPNIEDLAKMFDLDEITNEMDIIKYGRKCIELGAKNVIVSVGEEGSYLFTSDGKAYRSYGVKGEEVNSFNSRDAMIGGFIGIYMRNQNVKEAFRMASAAASATAFVEDLADLELTQEVYEKTKVEEINLG